MVSKEEMQKFIDYATEKIYLYIESKFWSKPNLETLQKWVNNFDDIDEKYCAMKLLDRFVYFSEEDIVRLLQYGINENIINRYVLKHEIDNNFNLSNDNILNFKNTLVESMRFIPLTGNNKTPVSQLGQGFFVSQFNHIFRFNPKSLSLLNIHKITGSKSNITLKIKHL